MTQLMKWVLFVICALLILYLSMVNITTLPPLQVHMMDKVGHIIAYGVLTGLMIFALYKKGQWSRSQTLIVLSSMTFYGFFIEILQKSMTESRIFDILDIVANVMGMLIVFFLFSTTLKQ